MNSKPNIILITTDEMRGDCLGIAGHPDVKTPYLDTLAAQGIYFPNAYSACPSCIAARAALHTGLAPKHNGRIGYADGVRWDYPHTLAGELTAAGYQSRCVGKMHVHPLRNNLGFEEVELHDGYLHYYRRSSVPRAENQYFADDYLYWLKEEKGISADVTDTGLECNSWMARPWCYEEQYHPTNWATARAIDFLRKRDRDRPFFLNLSYVRPHAPYDAPKAYFDLYKNKSLRLPAMGDWADLQALENNAWVYNNQTGPKDPELIRQQQIGYYACITHVDGQIGRFLQALHDQDALENTVILFTSDHGELLSDHALVRKSRGYQGSVQIPMLLWGAGREGVCTQLTELRDIMPTFRSLAGCREEIPTDGISLLDEAALSRREYLHGEHSHGALSSHFIITEGDKYIWYSQTGTERYFDLQNDPRELHDAATQQPERVTYLRGLLIEELKGRPEGYTDGNALLIGKTPLNVLK